MKTATRSNPMTSRSVYVAGTAAMLALAALAFAGHAEAGGNVSFSIGVGNAYPLYPAYQQRVYVQPQVVYEQPAQVYYQPPYPVYLQPRPVYVQPQVIYQQPQPTYNSRPHHRRHGGGYYVQSPRHGNGNGYGLGYVYGRGAVPVYYGR